MPDRQSKIRAKIIIRIIHPEFDDVDVDDTEKPDIQFVKHRYGVEVTRAFNIAEGKFYAGMIKDLLEDTDNITERICHSINIKTEKAPNYYAENPWMKRLGLAIIVGYPLDREDLEQVVSKITPKTRRLYFEIFFIMPLSAYLYDGYKIKIIME